MDIAFDVETLKKGENGEYEYVLDGTGEHFILGAVVKENGSKKVFYHKQEMWNYIKDLAKSEYKRGKKLRIFAHNTRYDFYNIADLKDKNIVWFSEFPFIVSYLGEIEREFDGWDELRRWEYWAKREGIYYKRNGLKVTYRKEMAKYGDTLSIFRMSLKKLGDLIDIPKLEMPEAVGTKLTQKKLKELSKYCINDCVVTLEAVKRVKKKLKEEGIVLRNLCTINQIAISYIIKKLMDIEGSNILMKNKEGEMTKFTYKTKYPDLIHNAYRAGLTRVFKVGKYENVYDIDANSLYPYSLTRLLFLPDLSTERMVKDPLNIFEKDELLNYIGVSRVMLKNKSCEYGFIPIRTNDRSYVPEVGKYIIGDYTHLDLKKALEEGYELIDVEWSILWDPSENNLKEIYMDLYKKRLEDGDKFNYYFYKSIMNSSLGKFGQRRVNQELFIDSVEKIEEYKEKNAEVIRGIDGTRNLLYKRVTSEKMKPYYAPIIPALVTSMARIVMYDAFKKIPKEDLLYSDVDSIIMKGNYLSEFNIGDSLGQFKVEKDNETNEDLAGTDALIWGSKCKRVGNNMALAGAFKSSLTREDFDKGVAKTKKMMGIKNMRDEKAGSFIEEMRDLKAQMENWKNSEELLREELLYIDSNVDNVGYFTKHIGVLPLSISSNI